MNPQLKKPAPSRRLIPGRPVGISSRALERLSSIYEYRSAGFLARTAACGPLARRQLYAGDEQRLMRWPRPFRLRLINPLKTERRAEDPQADHQQQSLRHQRFQSVRVNQRGCRARTAADDSRF